MNLLIGLVLMFVSGGMAGYWRFVDPAVADVQYFVQMGIAGLGGLYLAVTSINFSKKEDADMNNEGGVEYDDYKCLNYLLRRAKDFKSNEISELVVQLNDALFKAKAAESSNVQS